MTRRSSSRNGRKTVEKTQCRAAKPSKAVEVSIFRLPLEALAAARDTLDYERSLIDHYFFGTKFRESGALYFQSQWEGDSEADGLRKRVQAFSLAQALLMWNEPHYRAPSYAHDLSAK